MIVFTVHCGAPEEAFAEFYDDLAADLREAIEEQRGLPCDGGGRPGWWCERCRWAKRGWEVEDGLANARD